MSDPLHRVWAKSAPDGKDKGDTLTKHTADVLMRLGAWRRRYPGLSDLARSDLWSLAGWAVALHDIGKCARGFQIMVGNPEYGGSAERRERFPWRHEVLSLAAAGWLEVDDERLGLVAGAIVTHHRDWQDLQLDYGPSGNGRAELLAQLDPADEAAWPAWLELQSRALEKKGFAPLPPFAARPPGDALRRAMRAVALLVQSICDDEQDARGPLSRAARVMRGLVVLADHAGSAGEEPHVAQSLTSVRAFREATKDGVTRLFPHQSASAETTGHALLVAPTGSGKTESALLWASRQREVLEGHRALFYVLPYRASLDAMHRRMGRYGLDPTDDVVLQHAKASTSLYRWLLDRTSAPSEAEQITKRMQNLGRLMTAPVRVLTPYQLLRAIFGLKGHEAMLTDAAGGLFVLDELHAYDVDRLGMILATLSHLSADLGAQVFAMSATFPSVLRDALVASLGGSIAEVRATPETESDFVRHTLRFAERDLASEASIDTIVDRSRAGEAVLVVASTVKRAQRVFDRLRAAASGADVALLHGRFTGRDRAEKERRLFEQVRTGVRRDDARGVILVATQVVEVSLDVDLDVLFSDPAPVEALIQRFGRVNRGRRGGLRDVVVHTEIPADGDWIYPRVVVEHALRVLRPFADQPIQERDVQDWVDAAYAPIASDWTSQLRRRIDDVTERVISANYPLGLGQTDLEQAFRDLFDGVEVVPACFREEYECLERDEPLRMGELRVPLSNGQWQRLFRAGKIDGDFVDVPYDSTRGLNLNADDDA